jgi:hypothetical protein
MPKRIIAALSESAGGCLPRRTVGAVERRTVLITRPPYQAYKYSGGRVTIMQLALGDLTGKPFAQMMQESSADL